MITKTYLDGKLDQLEGKIERKIDFKIDQAMQKLNSEIAKLKNDLKALEEKKSENKDIFDSQGDVDKKLIEEINLLSSRISKLEIIIDNKLFARTDEIRDDAKTITDESDTIKPDKI